MKLLICYILAGFALIQTGLLYADYKDDIGHSQLATELGTSLPDGSGVKVSQAEADTDGVYGAPFTALPDASDSRFSEKNIVNITAGNNTISGHATSVGSYLYGNTGMASGITQIDAYEANGWMVADYLYYSSGWQPLISSSRIANHSWVGNVTDLAVASELLRRIDWVIETDEFLQFVGTRNSIGTNYNLFSAAYNVLAVGKTDGNHSTGSPYVDTDYPSGRIRTEIVAPKSTTSAATPIVAATAALLVDTGHANPALSTDPGEISTSNRNGDTIYNAERSEVIKAALLAGADRLTLNTSTTANITDYRADAANQTNNGLDIRFGAGQVNAYNSYQIIAAGEQNSLQDNSASAGEISNHGFDYDPEFGGGSGSNNLASYYFSTGTEPQILTASLVWNIDIDGGRRTSFDQTATLYDLDLYLYDITGSQIELINSSSNIDNSENIWINLTANRNYLLQVMPKAGQGNFNWDYALAWRLASDLDGDGIADTQDNCPANANSNQADLDQDMTGDACDSDIDGDGTPNTTDAFPYDPTETTDTDNDGTGNNTDTDDDNDGLSDTDEINIYGTNPLLIDTDGDSYSDGDEVTAGTSPTDPASYPVAANGDLNNDGDYNVLDILLGQQILAGIIPLSQEYLDRGDVAPLINGTPSPDGVFNVGDLVVIQRKVFGLVNF